MKTLIKLELKRNQIRTYLISALIIMAAMLCFLYLFAYAPMLEPDDADMEIFSGYSNLIPLSGVLNMAAFCVQSAVMSTKFIIEDYSGKRPVLLFSYPVSRKKILLSKLSIVSIFTIISMVSSYLINFCIFGATESFLHLTGQEFTFSIMLEAVETIFLMSLAAASIGMIAAGIGFIKKSVPATVISAVLIASLMCNIVANMASDSGLIYILTLLMILAGTALSLVMIKKVDVMEAV